MRWPRRAQGDVERVELLLEPADADAEVDPPAREPVERRHLLGHVDRVALGQEQHGGAQTHAAGAGGQVGQGDQGLEQAAAGRGGDAPVLGVGVVAGVLGEEHDVLAHPDGADPALRKVRPCCAT